MATLSVDSIWNLLQSMSLTASNELWLSEKLHESAINKQQQMQTEKDEALNRIYGCWTDSDDAKQMETAISEARKSDYVRDLVSFDD